MPANMMMYLINRVLPSIFPTVKVTFPRLFTSDTGYRDLWPVRLSSKYPYSRGSNFKGSKLAEPSVKPRSSPPLVDRPARSESVISLFSSWSPGEKGTCLIFLPGTGSAAERRSPNGRSGTRKEGRKKKFSRSRRRSIPLYPAPR